MPKPAPKPKPLSAPNAPTGLTATPGNMLINLAWTAPSNGGSVITAYRLYRNDQLWHQTAGARFYLDNTSLVAGSQYRYRVSAVNAIGEGPKSAEVSVTAINTNPPPVYTAPGAPASLIATAGNGLVNLAWTVPGSNGGTAITGYRVYRNSTSLIVLGNVLTYQNTGLVNGTPYSYQVAAINAVGEGPQSVSKTATPSGSARAIGAYVHNWGWEYALLDSYTTTIGRKPAFATSYHHWGTTDGSEWPAQMIAQMTSRGITPFLTWEAWNNYQGGSDPLFNLDSTINGSHNAVLDRWITGAVAYGQPVYIRMAHEMNGDWYPWCFGNGHIGNTAAKYITFWRYVVNRFRAGGATNVKWVWSPNVVDTDKPLLASYPGDAYVDITAMDGYNWGTSQGWSTWQTFTQTFASTYSQIQALAPNKPIMVAETASSEIGGNKSAWITNAYLTEIPTSFPKLVAVLWFNQNKETDWRVESSAASLNAFKAAVARPEWQGAL